ncbi:hypothetical protein AAIR98_000115 [Elusimicrobium simillimum]
MILLWDCNKKINLLDKNVNIDTILNLTYEHMRDEVSSVQKSKKLSQTVKVVKPTKTNMGWNYLVYEDIQVAKSWLEDNPNYEKYNKLDSLEDAIFESSYDYEKEKFKVANAGFDFDEVLNLDNEITKFSSGTGFGDPNNKNLVYGLANMKVLQVTKDGLLIGSTKLLSNNTAFVFTDKKDFVDNQTFDTKYGFVKYDKNYQYTSVMGSTKTVLGYKFIPFEKYEKQFSKMFFIQKPIIQMLIRAKWL